MSYRGAAMCIISTAQQARPKVNGHKEPLRPQLRTSSNRATVQSAQFDCFLKIEFRMINELQHLKILPSERSCWKSLGIISLDNGHCLLVTFLLTVHRGHADCLQKMVVFAHQRARRKYCVANHLYWWILCNDTDILSVSEGVRLQATLEYNLITLL